MPQPLTLTAFVPHERLMDCIHCGLCLSQCPTYAEEGLEADSPRGRIYLMRALAEGRATPTPSLVEHLDLCLGCRACETACPSGVQYGRLIEGTRAFLRQQGVRSARQTRLSRLIENTFPYPNRLELALLPLRLARRWGILTALRRLGVMRLLGNLGEMEQMLPPLPPMSKRLRFASKWRARGVKQARVGMVTGCVMPVLQGHVNEATARVLAKAGCEVEAPKAQNCCGALHAHVGAMEEAKALARRNIEAFESCETDGMLDAIIINAAGCGSALKEYGHWLHDDPQWAKRAERFSAQVRDVSEWLAEERFKSRLTALMPSGELSGVSVQPMRDIAREVVPNTGGAATLGEADEANRIASLDVDSVVSADEATSGQRPQPPHQGGCDQPIGAPFGSNPQSQIRNRLTYHDACHLCHGQGIRQQPRELLGLLPDVEIVSLQESEMCCGSAGIYNLTQPAMANRLLERKMRHVAQTGAATVVTGNPGCALQLRFGAQKFGVPIDVKHPVELLDQETGK